MLLTCMSMSLAGFKSGSEPLHVLEMKGIQTGLRTDTIFPGYSSFACMGHKWEDDYLQNSCRWSKQLYHAWPASTPPLLLNVCPAESDCAAEAHSTTQSSKSLQGRSKLTLLLSLGSHIERFKRRPCSESSSKLKGIMCAGSMTSA